RLLLLGDRSLHGGRPAAVLPGGRVRWVCQGIAPPRGTSQAVTDRAPRLPAAAPPGPGRMCGRRAGEGEVVARASGTPAQRSVTGPAGPGSRGLLNRRELLAGLLLVPPAMAGCALGGAGEPSGPDPLVALAEAARADAALAAAAIAA